MSDSVQHLDLISASQSAKETTANSLIDALSPSSLFGRRATTTTGLTWGYYGGVLNVAGTPTQIANGTVALTGSATNYVESTTAGVVSVNTSAFTAGRLQLYTVICGASSVTSYTDHRHSGTGAGIVGGSGTVTSVAMSVPAELSVSGSPVTTAGTLAVTKATQTANTVWAGPTSGGVAQPVFRALVAADIPAQPFDATVFYPGIPTNSAKVLRVPVARAVTFADDFAGSYGTASAAATASAAFDILKNGSSVGTMTFALGATTATFVTAAGTVVLAAGDTIAITAPASADATLADIGIVLAGTR